MIFTPVEFGPLRLKNRIIRAAAFEGMSRGHGVTEDLKRYHLSLAKGGVAMTTLAYAAVSKEALSFPHQMWLRDEILPDLTRLTDEIHQNQCAVSIQIGHCGNMAKRSVTGMRPISASAKMNLYGPTFPKEATVNDIDRIIADFGQSVELAVRAGFDAVEVHAGHGYLISQFLSPYTNKRKDEYGGSHENRMRFMHQVMSEVVRVAGNRIAVIVKMNMYDGFEGGITIDESLQVAKRLQSLGVHGLVLSGGFVSKAPMQVMRGTMPVRVMARGIESLTERLLVRYASPFLIPNVPYEENYFLKDALLFRKEIDMPLIYVGGVKTECNMIEVLRHGFDAVQIARALISNPDFIGQLKDKITSKALCDVCNECIAKMYTGKIQCKFNAAL